MKLPADFRDRLVKNLVRSGVTRESAEKTADLIVPGTSLLWNELVEASAALGLALARFDNAIEAWQQTMPTSVPVETADEGGGRTQEARRGGTQASGDETLGSTPSATRPSVESP